VRLWFYRAKQSLRHKLAKKGLTRDCLLPALATFAYLTAPESQKASAATALSAASLENARTTVLLGTLTSRTALGALGLLLAMALVVGLTAPEIPAPDATPPAPAVQEAAPALDDSLVLIFDDVGRPSGYTSLDQVSRSNHPEGQAWKHFVFWPQLEPARMLESPIDDTSCSLLALGEGQWIEYELPRAIADRAGPEIAAYLCNWGSLPRFFVTDGQSQEMQILASTYIGTYPQGAIGLGFDLSEIDCPFVIRGIRIRGNDNAGPYEGCGLDPPKVYLEPIDPIFRDRGLFRDD
jgi:hypothetical protein